MLKKILFLSAFAFLAFGTASALQINKVYTVTASTDVVTDTTTLTAQISAPSVRIKMLSINNPAGVAQTVTIYKNARSTTTVTAVGSWDIPATGGMYYPFGTSALTDEQNFDCPYFAVRTSTSTNPVNVTVLYKD